MPSTSPHLRQRHRSELCVRYNFQTVTSAALNRPEKVFSNNPRTMQLSAKFSF